MIRRQFAPVFLIFVASVLAGSAYIVLSQPLYTASSSIYAELEGTQTEESSLVQLDTHVELIRSDKTTSAVIDELGLSDMFSTDPGLLRSTVVNIRRWLEVEALEVAFATDDERTEIIQQVKGALEVERVGNTAIIDVTYTSPSKALSVAIANAFASNYLEEVAEREEQSAARRVRQLQERADEVRRRASSANESVRNLRFQNNFAVADAADLGRQIAELRARLSAVNSEEAALQARLALVSGAGDVETLHTGALQSPEAVELFSSFTTASGKLAQLRERPGVSEATLAQLEGAVAEMREALAREMRRARDGLELDLAVIAARRSSALEEFNELAKYAGSTAWSELLEAENEATLYEGMYQAYLNDLESAYRQDPRSSVRLISEALPPLNPSFPNHKVVLALAGTIGLVAGFAIAMYREWTRNAGPMRR
jgi:succinoglycan biosynthesis transport protein ExoP